MDSLCKASYACVLKANPEANELLGFNCFKETFWKFQKLLELPEFHQLFLECAPKPVEYIWENIDKIAKGKEMEFLENYFGGTTYADKVETFLKQAVEKMKENTAADR